MQAALILILCLATGAGATEALRARDAEIRAALPPSGAKVTPAARSRIEAIVTRAVDTQAIVEAALGKRWSELSAAQRRRLVAAFESRFRRASGSELDAYRSTQIEYLPEVGADGGVLQIPTRVVVKGEPTEITYTMKRQRSGWRIVDIVIDGVSTVANYRSSFARIISKEGVEGLIKRLERGASSAQPSSMPGSKTESTP
jgi:phospholipid transport system substrate-binding protein